MERKIGEVFEYQGKKLQVKAGSNDNSCGGCIFNGSCTRGDKLITGFCEKGYRDDKKDVIFVEVQEQKAEEPKERKVGETFENEEQTQEGQQAEQPQKLNLCEILKYCPAGELFWSPMLGDVKFYGIDHTIKRVCVTAVNNVTLGINADGTLTVDDITSEDVMLYPSREQRDWTKVKYEPKKELPRTWEEFCKNYERKKGDSYIDLYSEICTCSYGGYSREIDHDRNMLPSKQAAEAHLALMQLHQLRDAWREGWMPEWTDDNQNKYVILSFEGEYEIFQRNLTSHFLSFQDEKRAYEFKDCFIDLIRKAGDLI